MKRRNKIRIASFSAALFAVMLIWGISGSVKAAKYKMQINITQQRALLQMCEYLDSMETTLKKATYAGTPKMLDELSSQLSTQALGAKTSLSALSSGDTSLYNMYKFLSQVGEYTRSLNKKMSAGENISAEERKTLESLLSYAESLSVQFSYMSELMDAGYFSFEEIKDALNKTDENSEDMVSFMNSAADAEESLKDFPTLIYDGPYSDNILSKESVLLKQSGEISLAEAKKKAAQYLGTEERMIFEDSDTQGRIPTYNFHADNIRIAVTKNGGMLAYMLSDTSAGVEKMSASQAVQKAKEFLERVGFSDMVSTYFMTEDGICVTNFAYKTGGYVCYPDLIKVGVSLSDGLIVSMDARDYIMNHYNRELPAVGVSVQSASDAVAKNLKINKISNAVIPSSGGGEFFTYEFLCTDKSGQDVLVYIDVETGQEDDILILLYSDGGTLTK
ncbi:MAG: germination protein YpeB [Oscillospiraceae bacterium]|nr:germination protein YpeB [Oscillospiraceae bacterium]